MLGFSILMLCVAPLWVTPSPEERILSPRLLLIYGPLIILALAAGVYSLWLAHSPAKRSRIILESDRLVYQRSLGRHARKVLYGQICWVALRTYL